VTDYIEAFSFFFDLFFLITWSFPARGWNRTHLSGEWFSFTEMKHFPGILKCFSFAIQNELLHDGSIQKRRNHFKTSF
jgi:hypothetical protein